MIQAIESGAYATSDEDVAAAAEAEMPARTSSRRIERSRAYRLEYCGALRAFLSPYFRRSFSRASRRR